MPPLRIERTFDYPGTMGTPEVTDANSPDDVEVDDVEALDEQRLADLDARLGTLAAQLHTIGIELTETFAEFSTGGGLQGSNHRTAAQWLSVRTKLPISETRRIVALTERLDDLPTLTAAAHDGRVSLGVMANAARVTTADNEADIAHIALATTPTQSARILAAYRSLRDTHDDADTDDEPTEPLPPEPSSWWRLWYDDEGRGRIDAALDPATAALLEAAWDAARTGHQPNADEHGCDSCGTRAPSPDEIAATLATTVLDHAHRAGLTGPGRELFNVAVTVDLGTLTRVLGIEHDPTAVVRLGSQAFIAGTGQHLDDHQLAEVLCDATLQVLVEHDGAPLWLGNEHRAANRQQRRALHRRSGGGCEFPGCTQTRHLHAHHVVFHRHGGRTSLDNLVLLCGHHHREVHRRHWIITTNGNQRFTFWADGECLGTTTTPTAAGGPPPDLQLRPRDPVPPPPRRRPDAPRSDTGGERLTPFALDVYLTNLLAA